MRFPTRILALALALPASGAFGLGFQTADRAFRRMPVSSAKFALHPFQAHDADKPAGFSLFQNGHLSFNDTILRALRDKMTNPLLEIRSTDSRGLSLVDTGTKSHEIRFYVAGVPLCGFQMKAHELADRSTLVLGDLPNVDLNEPLPSRDWPDFDLSLDQVKAQVGTDRVKVLSSSKCLYASGGSLLPVWKLKVEIDALPYRVLADGYEVVALENGYFDVDGSATAYEQNILEGAAKSVPLTDLAGDGTLTSTYLKTYVPSTYTRASSATNKFDFPETDKQFEEVQTYVHAQAHLDFFKALGFEWYGPQPIQIKIHVKPGGQSNNALFTPGSDEDGSLPQIQIDDGDGAILRNLVTDGDVVSHEFGHHVIYRTLTSTSGESLILHEGLADGFVFMRTGNACLGESICPKGTTACIIEGQCLRSGEIDLKYQDENWNAWSRQGHLRGQLISGFIWDLYKGDKLAQDSVSALVFKAISYFREDSGLRDFVLAMFTADRDLYAGANFELIKATAEAHNLGEFIVDVVPTAIPALEGTTSALPQDLSDDKGKKKDKGDDNPFKCGTISIPSGDASKVFLLFLISLPLILAATPVRVPSKLKRRR